MTMQDPTTTADITSRELAALSQDRAAAEAKLCALGAKDKQRWDDAIVPVEYEVDDMVLMTNEGGCDLEPHYKGPYIMTPCYPDSGNCKLETMAGELIDTVHTDRLKKAHGSKQNAPWYEPSSELRRPNFPPASSRHNNDNHFINKTSVIKCTTYVILHCTFIHWYLQFFCYLFL